jgi:hypothetical protein
MLKGGGIRNLQQVCGGIKRPPYFPPFSTAYYAPCFCHVLPLIGFSANSRSFVQESVFVSVGPYRRYCFSQALSSYGRYFSSTSTAAIHYIVSLGSTAA